MIDFCNVDFIYNTHEVINNFSFHVNSGDFLAVIGSNGAGKSTFLKLCNGLLKPTAGDVTLLGKNTKKVKTSSFAKDVGFLFQNPDRQICCNTIKEEIAFSLKNLNYSKEEIDSKVSASLKEFNFDAEGEPYNLSRGQRQRLCLACLITLSPKILILDEPTTGLDYKECMELMNKISALNKVGCTVIMVCHDMEIVLDFAKRVLVMNDGKIIAEGKTRDILGNKEVLGKAKLLQPQIAETASILGGAYKNVFTVSEMIEKIKERKI